MEKDDIFKIHVTFGGWRLPLNISREDEELYRDAEKLLSRLNSKYKGIYSKKSNEELLVITAFHLAVALKKHDFAENTLPAFKKTELLSKKLNEFLSKQQED